MAWEEGEEAFCSAEVTSPHAAGCSLLRDTTEEELGEKKEKKKKSRFVQKREHFQRDFPVTEIQTHFFFPCLKLLSCSLTIFLAAVVYQKRFAEQVLGGAERCQRRSLFKRVGWKCHQK